MNLNTENLRSVAAVPLADPGSVPGWMISIGADAWLHKINADDIAQELFSDARFAALLLAGDAEPLGLHVLKVRREYAEALALRDLEAA